MRVSVDWERNTHLNLPGNALSAFGGAGGGVAGERFLLCLFGDMNDV